MTRFYVGTAGWSYLKWDKEFYPKDVKSADKLAFYATRFDAIEINHSFYHTPSVAQFKAWEKVVPGRFLFALKGPSYVTHIKRLMEPEKTLPSFLKPIAAQSKGGPILFQLPPNLPIDMTRLETFLKRLPAPRRYAIEMRHSSWHTPEVYKMLKKYKVAFCLFDSFEGVAPRVLTTNFAYVRLRGRKSSDIREFLGEWQRWLTTHTHTAYVFFNNGENKSLSFGNALMFREMTKN